MFDLLGLLSMTGANNPDLFAKVMASQGISPTQASGVPGTSLGGMPDMGGALGALLASPTAGVTGAVPGAATGAGLADAINPPVAASGTPPAGSSMLQALGALKAPQAPQPVFNAGVSGSQKAPELSQLKASNSANSLIMNLLSSLGNSASNVPSLGSVLKGV